MSWLFALRFPLFILVFIVLSELLLNFAVGNTYFIGGKQTKYIYSN